MARPTKARISFGPAEKLIPNKTITFRLAPTGDFRFLPGAFTKETKIIIDSAWCTGADNETQHFKGRTLLGVKVAGTYNTYEGSPGHGEIWLVDRPLS